MTDYSTELPLSNQMVHCHEVVLSTVHSVFIADFEHGHLFLFCFQVQYPSNPMQPEPIYFLFGVCNEGEGSQLFYLIDDSIVATKGAHVAVLYLHHYLSSHTSSEHLVLHADNCL